MIADNRLQESHNIRHLILVRFMPYHPTNIHPLVKVPRSEILLHSGGPSKKKAVSRHICEKFGAALCIAGGRKYSPSAGKHHHGGLGLQGVVA
jgi:hypothetical protein